MAGDWVKIEHATPHKPEIASIASIMQTTPEKAFLSVFQVWVWFDLHSYDGRTWRDVERDAARDESNAPRHAGVVTAALLSAIVGVPGIAEAMRAVGWLMESASGLECPNYDRHVSQTAKGRALAAKRSGKARSNRDKSNAPSVTKVTPGAQQVWDDRREATKELGIKNPPTPQNPAIAEVASQFSITSTKAKGSGLGYYKADGSGCVTEAAELLRHVPAALVLAEIARADRDRSEWFGDMAKRLLKQHAAGNGGAPGPTAEKVQADAAEKNAKARKRFPLPGDTPP